MFQTASDFFQFLLWDEPMVFALLVIVLEVPRYLFATVSLLFRPRGRRQQSGQPHSVSVIVPSHDAGTSLRDCVGSLFSQTMDLCEIIMVDDGSTDGSWDILKDLKETYPSLIIIHHAKRTGKSAAMNHGARYATGDLIMTLDADTQLDPGAIGVLAQAFDDPTVGIASGNIAISNRHENPLCELQSLEYLMSITSGRSFLDMVDAMACCSGAFSMIRKAPFDATGGFLTGPGEDLEISLRLRRMGYRSRFVSRATAWTEAVPRARGLIRQRMRWDRDAIQLRIFAYKHLTLGGVRISPSSILMKLDFLVMELAPTIIFPFYIMVMWQHYGPDVWPILWGMFQALFWFYTLNLALSVMIMKHRLRLVSLLVFPVMPIYQGLVLKLVRFVAYSQEILFSASRKDSFVPERVRKALYERHTE